MFIRTILITIVLGLMSTAAKAETIWKITSLNWQPYAGANMANQGNSVQVLRQLLKQHGITLIVEFYPWKRAQKVAKEPGYLGYFPAWPEEVYEGFVASKPVDWSELGIMKMYGTQIKSDRIKTLFEQHNVGYVKTYTYPAEINEAIKQHQFTASGAMSEMILLKKLAAGRHAVAITDPLVMTYLAQEHGIAGVEVHKVLKRLPLVIALRDAPDNHKNIQLLQSILQH